MKLFQAEQKLEWSPALPSEFSEAYKLGGYDENRILQVMWKYLMREANAQRAWVRINHHLPETMTQADPLDILEFSTAHGAMLEIWRHFGHRVRGTDYNWATHESTAVHKGVRKPWHRKALEELTSQTHSHSRAVMVEGWPYQPIIESLGLDVDLFDGADRPYPYDDKSYDVVCCYQAIEAYANPEDWLDILAEFCRIARRTVVVGFNPPPVFEAENEEYLVKARAAWIAMQQYNANGFRTVFFEMGRTRRGIHPTAVKLVAV